MSEPVKSTYDDEVLTGEAFESYCDDCHESYKTYYDGALNILASAIDDTNKDVLDSRRDLGRARQDIDDDFQRIVSLRESVEGLSEDVTQLRHSVNRTFTGTAVCSASLLGAAGAILVSVSLRKRR